MQNGIFQGLVSGEGGPRFSPSIGKTNTGVDRMIKGLTHVPNAPQVGAGFHDFGLEIPPSELVEKVAASKTGADNKNIEVVYGMDPVGSAGLVRRAVGQICSSARGSGVVIAHISLHCRHVVIDCTKRIVQTPLRKQGKATTGDQNSMSEMDGVCTAHLTVGLSESPPHSYPGQPRSTTKQELLQT